jgi:hypothetical protein
MHNKTCLKQTLLNRALSPVKFSSFVYVQDEDHHKIGHGKLELFNMDTEVKTKNQN